MVWNIKQDLSVHCHHEWTVSSFNTHSYTRTLKEKLKIRFTKFISEHMYNV